MALWASAVYDLGIPEERFWRLTFREYDALLERQKVHQGWQDYRAALICSVIASVNSSRRTYTPADFMPGLREPKERRRMSDAEMEQAARNINARLGGTQVEL